MMTRWLGFPQLASAHGLALDQATAVVHWIMLALFVGWGGFFLFALFRFRKGANPVADYAGVKSKASTYLEVAVAVAEAFLLIGLSFPLWAERVENLPPRADATVVHVIGEQFAWNIHYPGPDGEFGRRDNSLIDASTNPLGLDRTDPHAKDDVTTINQLYLPANKPVLIELSSKDVIHSFALWEMRIKQDAVPGLTIPVWFVPDVTTEEMRQRTGKADFQYEIGCAQLCGLGHYRMRGFVTVDTAEGYQKWMDEQQAQLKSDAESGDAWQ